MAWTSIASTAERHLAERKSLARLLLAAASVGQCNAEKNGVKRKQLTPRPVVPRASL